MSQSRVDSLIESTVNVVIGFLVALAGQLVIYPLMGLSVSMGQHLWICLFFTALSLLRSYLIRRVFNRLTVFRKSVVIKRNKGKRNYEY